jgi:hypothetical protein
MDSTSEYRVEYLNPPYMTVPRPQLLNVPQQLDFNHEFTVDVTIPPGLNTDESSIQGKPTEPYILFYGRN